MIGRAISEYRLVEKIGGGGMGEVWKAEDLKLEAAVALKFLPPELTRDADAKERFLREARVSFGLDHPNIGTVHGVGETDEGRLFIIMPFYEGETLDRKIQRGPIDPGEIRRLFTQLASGLSYAHDRGVVHRDVKPSNLMVTTEGALKILDFGIALLGDHTILTQTGTTAGTAAYMSPEQTRGEKVDARTDVWSAGVVLYEMLTGVRPFRGEYEQVVLYSILNTNPDPVASVREGIPDDLAAICEGCLAKDRERRLPSLTGAARIEPRSPRPAFAWFTGLSPSRKLLLVSAVAGAIAVVVMILPTSPPVQDTRSLVAVAPFRNLTGDRSVDQWLEPMQSMVDQEMRHLGLATFDIGGVNASVAGVGGTGVGPRTDARDETFRERGIRYLINGDIGASPGAYTLKLELQDLKVGGISETGQAEFSDFRKASQALVQLLPQVTSFLRMKDIPLQKSDDLDAWTAGRRLNIQAHQALMQAFGFIYRMEPGGERYLRRAIELDSLFITPRVWLISSLSTKGRQEEALSHYQFLRGIEAEADPFEQVMIDWCGSYIRRDIEAQERALKQALEYYPGNNILIVNLARIRYIEQDWQGTIETIRPLVRAKWSYSPTYWFYAQASMRLNRFDDARDALEAGLKASPSVYPDTYALLAVSYLRLGDEAKAELNTKKFISRWQFGADSLWLAYAELGELCSESGLPHSAARFYREAVTRLPSGTAYRDSLVSSLIRAGKFDDARKECDALRLADSAGTAHLYLAGRINEGLGRTDSAMRSYERFLSIDSTGARATDARERLSRIRH